MLYAQCTQQTQIEWTSFGEWYGVFFVVSRPLMSAQHWFFVNLWQKDFCDIVDMHWQDTQYYRWSNAFRPIRNSIAEGSTFTALSVKVTLKKCQVTSVHWTDITVNQRFQYPDGRIYSSIISEECESMSNSKVRNVRWVQLTFIVWMWHLTNTHGCVELSKHGEIANIMIITNLNTVIRIIQCQV